MRVHGNHVHWRCFPRIAAKGCCLMNGRELNLTRYTQPEPELTLLLERLNLSLPDQAPPKITAVQTTAATTPL